MRCIHALQGYPRVEFSACGVLLSLEVEDDACGREEGSSGGSSFNKVPRYLLQVPIGSGGHRDP